MIPCGIHCFAMYNSEKILDFIVILFLIIGKFYNIFASVSLSLSIPLFCQRFYCNWTLGEELIACKINNLIFFYCVNLFFIHFFYNKNIIKFYFYIIYKANINIFNTIIITITIIYTYIYINNLSNLILFILILKTYKKHMENLSFESIEQ